MRVLTVTAVAAERDAVTRAVGGGDAATAESVPLPGSLVLHRMRWPSPDAPGGTAGAASREAALVVDVLATGVGVGAAATGAATALTVAAVGGAPYGLVVSAGIGGGFVHDTAREGTAQEGTAQHRNARPSDSPRLGGTVVATAVVAADLGAQTSAPGSGGGDGFVPVTELGFGTVVHTPPPALVRLVAEATGATPGPVLTVSTVTGTAERAAELAARHPGAVAEAMEGFGAAEAAAAHGVPVCEIRTVSNAVGPRDRAAWRIPDALNALTTAFEKTLPGLDGWKEHD